MTQLSWSCGGGGGGGGACRLVEQEGILVASFKERREELWIERWGMAALHGMGHKPTSLLAPGSVMAERVRSRNRQTQIAPAAVGSRNALKLRAEIGAEMVRVAVDVLREGEYHSALEFQFFVSVFLLWGLCLSVCLYVCVCFCFCDRSLGYGGCNREQGPPHAGSESLECTKFGTWGSCEMMRGHNPSLFFLFKFFSKG